MELDLHEVAHAFRQVMLEAGLTPPGDIVPGKLYRFPGAGKGRGNTAGRCMLFPDGLGGWLQDLSNGGEIIYWRAEHAKAMTAEQRREHERLLAEARAAAERERKEREAKAAKMARRILNAAKNDEVDGHRYVVAKGGLSFGSLVKRGPWPQRGWKDALLVPLYDKDGRLTTLSAIPPKGKKDLLAGGRKQGCFHPIGKFRGTTGPVLIGEGLATVAAACEATGYPGVVAVDAGNLEPVTKVVRELAPRAEIIILADDDQKPGRDDNPGITAATRAAKAVGGRLVMPGLGRKADFWDVWHEQGPEAVRKIIEQALSSGLTKSGVPGVPSEDERPCFRVFDERVDRSGGRQLRPGVYYFDIQPGRGDKPPELTQKWVCNPLHIEAVTYDHQENNFGRLLRFRNTLGRWREWAMPMELLSGSGEELRAALLSMGVEIDPRAKNLLNQYLLSASPTRRVRCALQTGWCDGAFVLPDTVIGPNASDVVFQSAEVAHDEYTKAGTLEDWKEAIAALAVGNPLLVLALSCAFAGPLLGRCNAEGGGIHFVGDSSTGKSTALEAACSVWGGTSFKRSWRATANGLEGAAALFNDGLLVLDEISECDPKDVGKIVYMLGNGRGKQRATRTGLARSVARWRCVILSSGERGLEATLNEGGYRVKAGQEIRLLSIPAARQYGVFDELHDFPDGASLANAIKDAWPKCHGVAGRAFLEKLTCDTRDFSTVLADFRQESAFAPPGAEGQEVRAGGRFALIAMAGELATEYGLTGWPEGEALRAAVEGFRIWRSERGRGNSERKQVIEAVARFIDKHGDARFSDANNTDDIRVHNRAGWWSDTDNGRIFYFNSAGMREALTGFEFKRALNILQEAGVIPASGADGRRATPRYCGGRRVRVYEVHPDKLEVADEP